MSDSEQSNGYRGAPLDPEPAGVGAFLDAVDRAMNSNTLLLTARCPQPVTAGNRRQALHAFLRSGAFEQLLRDADERRGWSNLADGPLLRTGFGAAVSPLGHPEFLARLRWMLRGAFSPYGRHYPAADTERLVAGFAADLLGANSGGWSFAAVRPDFLRCSGYYSGAEPVPPVYFDGGASDTATLIHRGRTLHLLLTNGSP